MKELEKRMYGLVPYNISPIQQAIQFGHAVVEYSLKFNLIDYLDWAKNWKTFIILNGGTSNESPDIPGTMQQHIEILRENKITIAAFYEPDLNNMLSAITFIVDERVFNKEDYPDFREYLNGVGSKPLDNSLTDDELQDKYSLDWFDWRDALGVENVFLREFLTQFRLA